VTGRIVRQQVLTRMVVQGETSFLGRSSDLDRSSGNGVRVYDTGLGFATCLRFFRIELLDLTSLETRRLSGDSVEVFKILKGYENNNKDLFFLICHSPVSIIIH